MGLRPGFEYPPRDALTFTSSCDCDIAATLQRQSPPSQPVHRPLSFGSPARPPPFVWPTRKAAPFTTSTSSTTRAVTSTPPTQLCRRSSALATPPSNPRIPRLVGKTLIRHASRPSPPALSPLPAATYRAPPFLPAPRKMRPRPAFAPPAPLRAAPPPARSRRAANPRRCLPPRAAAYRVPNYTVPDYTSPDRVDHLLEAIKFNDYPAFVRLVDTLPDGANTVFPNKSNQSALLAACFRGRTRMIRLLVQRGADCAYRNDWGWGAVQYCKQWYWNLNMLDEGEQVVRLLVQHGADDVTNWRGP